MRAAAALAVLTIIVPLLLPIAMGDGEPAANAATAYNTQRKIARDAMGDIFVAYVQGGQGTKVLVAHSRDDGRSWEDLTPPTTPGQPSDRASLAVDSHGTLHLAWTETTIELYRQVFYASYRHGSWSAPTQLSFTKGYSGFPSLAVDSRDRVHVVWYGYDGQAYQVTYRYLDGGRWSDLQLLTSGSLDALNPALAVGPDDTLYVAYYRLSGADTRVYYFNSRPAWGTPQILSDPQRASSDPTQAIDSKGVVHVAWSTGDGNRSAIIYRNLSAGVWSPPLELSSPAASAQHPSLTVDAAGRITVFWDQDDGQIYKARWDGGWGAPEVLTHGGRNTYPTTRWAAFGDGPAGTLDYAWTHEADGKLQLAFGSTGSGLIGSQGSPPATVPLPYIVLAIAGTVVGAATVLLVQRRRRP